MENRAETGTMMMKRRASELALLEYLSQAMAPSDGNDDAVDPSSDLSHWDFTDYGDGRLEESLFWSETLIPTIPTIDSQSSICENLSADSPVSANKPEARRETGRARSGSCHDYSDVEDTETTQAGLSDEHTADPSHLRRLKRMVSNRESAKRSRRRKQQHLAELESRVEQLRGENSNLCKQLVSATHQYRNAGTSNRVLKSDVETLRVKVKLAEDLVARGSLSVTSSLDQLLETRLSQLQQPINNLSFPGNPLHGDQSRFPSSALGSIASDAVSCVSEIWP